MVMTLLPGGQTATKCEIIYFILKILKDFFILYVSIIVVQYSTKRSCPEYETIPVGGLRAEQFAIKVDRVYRDLQQLWKHAK